MSIRNTSDGSIRNEAGIRSASLVSPASNQVQQLKDRAFLARRAEKAQRDAPNLSIAHLSIVRKIDERSQLTHLTGVPTSDNGGIITRSPKNMLGLERVWEARNRTPVLLASGAIMLAVALVDWWTMPYVSLGFLYVFPIILVAGFLPRWSIALLGVTCAILAEVFSALSRSFTRLTFETLALAGCGLFVAELIRNRRITVESQDRLRALVETSPAAIVTVDERGFIELANRAAVDLMAPRDGHLIGNPIAAFLPDLHHALRWEDAPQFRATMQCRGHRGNGEAFMADVWFSTYKEGQSPKLAAIIGDVSEETPVGANSPLSGEQHERIALNSRELEVLRLLVQGLANKEIAAKLGISESAVKNTLQQLFTKTSVRTRSQLVRVGLEHYRNLL
jgi:PAS domain S-box-containing protein